MLNFKASVLALVVLVSVPSRKPQKQARFDYGTGLGIAVEKADGTCLDIYNGALSKGQRIQFITTTAPQTTGDAEITRSVDKACTAIDQNKPGLYHYEFKVVRGSLQDATPAFVLANFNGTLTVAAGEVSADLDGNGQSESFRSCASTEGIHMTVWTGKPLQGRRRWHYYYYLGYDVEADCQDADTKPDTP